MRTLIMYKEMGCGNMTETAPDYDLILRCLLHADADLLRLEECFFNQKCAGAEIEN